MGSIMDRNGMNLTEAEDIKKRWQLRPSDDGEEQEEREKGGGGRP